MLVNTNEQEHTFLIDSKLNCNKKILNFYKRVYFSNIQDEFFITLVITIVN